MWPKPQFPMDSVTFTEEIFNGKLNFFVQCVSFVFKVEHFPSQLVE